MGWQDQGLGTGWLGMEVEVRGQGSEVGTHVPSVLSGISRVSLLTHRPPSSRQPLRRTVVGAKASGVWQDPRPPTLCQVPHHPKSHARVCRHRVPPAGSPSLPSGSRHHALPQAAPRPLPATPHPQAALASFPRQTRVPLDGEKADGVVSEAQTSSGPGHWARRTGSGGGGWTDDLGEVPAQGSQFKGKG